VIADNVSDRHGPSEVVLNGDKQIHTICTTLSMTVLLTGRCAVAVKAPCNVQGHTFDTLACCTTCPENNTTKFQAQNLNYLRYLRNEEIGLQVRACGSLATCLTAMKLVCGVHDLVCHTECKTVVIKEGRRFWIMCTVSLVLKITDMKGNS
jgi:hypothetical protein